MRRIIILILAMLLGIAVSAHSKDPIRKAIRYQKEAECCQKKADGYSRKAAFLLKKVGNYQRKLSRYTKKGYGERARNMAVLADEAAEKCKMHLRHAAQADTKAVLYNRWAIRALENDKAKK